MKKKLLMLALTLLVAGGAMAQVYLANTLKPVSERRCTRFTTKDKPFCIARYGYRGGFVLKTGMGGLISADNPGGHVAYNLNGAYEKLTFVMGPYGGEYYGPEFENLNGPNSAGDGSNVIVTVRGDGRILLDEVVWNHDAPREVTLDVKGVKELRFDVIRGETDLAVGAIHLWKPGQKPTPTTTPLKLPAGKITLVKDLWPHYIRHSGWVAAITDRTQSMGCNMTESISINRVTYNTGLQFSLDMALAGTNKSWAYFWLQKKYDKVSFIVGPRDNQSSRSKAWLTVKADGKIIYEKKVSQTDMAERVVLDVKGVNQLSFHGEYSDGDFVASITFGVVNIEAWPAGSSGVPQAGEVNGSKDRISKLPDVCAMCSNIPPYSVRGVSGHSNTYFDGSSRHYTFSMGGEKFWEGFILTTGTTLFDDNINSFATFDLAGEYDWISFTAGCLTQHRVLDDDIIRVYADDKLILETTIHATWPNQHFELPLNRCRNLKFVKPGTGESKQVYFGIADVVLYRGKPRANDLFVHEKPDCPPQADLIDLCQRPYFHYVGRYLSSLTNFDFNDCFKNGSSQREYFQMKDGRKIYKGIMLETNIPPLDLEGMTIGKALGAMFLPIEGMAVVDDKGHQSSVAVFNPYREYESVTFTVANKSEYVDPFCEYFSDGKMPPVQLLVLADQKPVAEIMVDNNMMPTTITVPIHRCEQLMFWLQCGDVRSGQYVIYDITVDKRILPQTPGTLPTRKTVNEHRANQPQAAPQPAPAKAKPAKEKKSKPKKQKAPVSWTPVKHSGDKSMDAFIDAVDILWKTTQEMLAKGESQYTLQQNFVQATDGTVYKAVTFRGLDGQKLGISGIIRTNNTFANAAKTVKAKALDADICLPSATLAVPSTPDFIYYGRIIKLGTNVIAQCRQQAEELVELKELENENLNGLLRQVVTVDGVESTDKTLLLPLGPDEQVPPGTALQQVRYYKMD